MNLPVINFFRGCRRSRREGGIIIPGILFNCLFINYHFMTLTVKCCSYPNLVLAVLGGKNAEAEVIFGAESFPEMLWLVTGCRVKL